MVVSIHWLSSFFKSQILLGRSKIVKFSSSQETVLHRIRIMFTKYQSILMIPNLPTNIREWSTPRNSIFNPCCPHFTIFFAPLIKIPRGVISYMSREFQISPEAFCILLGPNDMFNCLRRLVADGANHNLSSKIMFLL